MPFLRCARTAACCAAWSSISSTTPRKRWKRARFAKSPFPPARTKMPKPLRFASRIPATEYRRRIRPALSSPFFHQGSRHRPGPGDCGAHCRRAWRHHSRRGQFSGRLALSDRTARGGVCAGHRRGPQRGGSLLMTARPHLLVVDDEAGIRESLSSILQDEGYFVEAVGSAEEALARAANGDVEVVLLDVWLPGMDGLEALSRLRTSQRPPAVIMISGHGTIETAVRATKLGAFDFIEKPLSLDKIIVLVRNAIQQRRLQEENQLLRTELGQRYQVIGESVPMKALRQQIAVTAPTNGRVLIYGESGTGKELVARALHAASLRSKGLFVEVNCAAIPEELIESELFGHVKGSFAGAGEDKIGKFKKADGGTLFLDEVGDMSLRTQSKVLRVLEEQRFEPVGSSQTMTVDVRVLAATNKNLEQEIARGAFRQDLFYRLNVIPFFVAPLRDRTADIPVLARHFLNEFSAAYGKRTRELSDTAMEILLRHPWPGNVRELRNLVERLVIICPQARIEPHHLPPEIFRGVAESPQHPYSTLHEARSAYEREFILRKLQEHRWNMTQTATALGLERSHLYRKMKSLGIAAPD